MTDAETLAMIDKEIARQRAESPDGKTGWDRVEDFRLTHRHLPSKESAPCPHCFAERTEALIKLQKAEAEVSRLKAENEGLRAMLEAEQDNRRRADAMWQAQPQASGEAEAALQQMLNLFTEEVFVNLDDGAIECRQDEDCDHCYLMQLVTESRALLAAPHSPQAKRFEALEKMASDMPELVKEIRAIVDGEFGGDWADHFGPLFDLFAKVYKALSALDASGEK